MIDADRLYRIDSRSRTDTPRAAYLTARLPDSRQLLLARKDPLCLLVFRPTGEFGLCHTRPIRRANPAATAQERTLESHGQMCSWLAELDAVDSPIEVRAFSLHDPLMAYIADAPRSFDDPEWDDDPDRPSTNQWWYDKGYFVLNLDTIEFWVDRNGDGFRA